MANLLVDERDVKFVLYELLEIEELCSREQYTDFSRDMFDMALEAAWKLAENEMWPTNADGDRQGVRLENGQARVPDSFHRVQRLYCEGGWPSLSISPDDGGQGFPAVMYCATVEPFIAANLGFMAYPGLTIGAARLLVKYGTEEQQRTYMDKMVTGEWAGTMCLTEPQAGSDVGALRTRAIRRPDGSFSIVGNKIFITSGDHDLTENIVHMVLARIEGAPAGTKGISIFIVPKKRIENGALVDNDIHTAAVERKMGIHGSATCALNFGENEDCVGYLLGEENQGMRIMFDMMNEARLGVGLQGFALAGGAYMHALRYANERVQGPDITAMKDPQAPKVPIIRHPDVRRMLMWMKSVVEGLRGLLYFAGYCEDRIQTGRTEAEIEEYRGMLDMLIPICKAWASDMGFRVTETAVQIHGGYGFCSEYPVEQYLRDIKITSIYEGTNGIQALDLVGRKLAYKQGALFRLFMGKIQELVGKAQAHERLKDIVEKLTAASGKLVEATTYFGGRAMSGDRLTPVLYATPYMELFGDTAVGYILLWEAEIASRKLDELYARAGADSAEARAELIESNKDAAFYEGKIATARFFANTFLSVAGGKAAAIMSGDTSAMDIPPNAFPL